MTLARRLAGVAATIVVAVTLPAVGARAAGPTTPGPAGPGPTPLQHIVVLMQENRSYDNYFGALHREGLPASEAEPQTGIGGVLPFHQPANCEVKDLNHEWTGTHLEINHGRMDGFLAQNRVPGDPTGQRAMGYYDDSDLPYYYGLASTFGIGDRYFSSVPGPTFPNRFYALAGTSFGHTDNDRAPTGGFTQPTIFGRLEQAGISWGVYDAQVATAALFADVQSHPDHVKPISQYFVDAAAGTLPQVVFLEPTYVGTVDKETDEHPPSNFQLGQQFTAQLLGALMASPEWSSSAFLLTWDEHGGYYDHVPPPAAPKPDSIPPILKPNDLRVPFNQYGPRVPLLVVSPFSKPHFVSHRVSDHTSILALIEHRFGLAPLTRRDAHANPLLEYFDFAHPHFTTPPTLPAPGVDPVKAAQCRAIQPGVLGA